MRAALDTARGERQTIADEIKRGPPERRSAADRGIGDAPNQVVSQEDAYRPGPRVVKSRADLRRFVFALARRDPLGRRDLLGGEFQVALALAAAWSASSDGWIARSLAELAGDTGIPRRSVIRHVAGLVGAGLVIVESGSNGLRSRYALALGGVTT